MKMKLHLLFTVIGLTCSHAEQVYIDANYNGNTTNAATGSATDWAVDPAVNANGAPAGDNIWGQRNIGPAAPAFGTTVWQLTSTETGPTLITTATGLLPNTMYGGLRVYFSGKESTGSGNEWYIDSSVNGVDYTTYKDGATRSTAVDISNGGVGVEIVPSASADIRYFASLPNGTTDAGGNLRIWVREGTGTDNRTVYDGIGFNNTPLSPPVPFVITAVTHDENNDTTTITWNSVDTANYIVQYSTDLESWSEVTDNAIGTGASTTLPIPLADIPLPLDTPRVFFRVLPKIIALADPA